MTLTISRLLFLAAVVALPVYQLPLLKISGFPLQPSDALFASSLLLWLISVLRGEARLQFDRFFILIGAYGAALCVSILTSEHPYISVAKFTGELFLFSVAFLSFQLILDDERMLKRTLLAWAAGIALTVVTTAASLTLFYVGYDTHLTNPLLSPFGTLPAGDYPRVRAFFTHTNMMTNYLNVAIPLLAIARRKGWLSRSANGFLMIGGWASALLTISPGIGGIFVSYAVQRFKTRGNGAVTILVLGLLVATAFVAVSVVSPDTGNTNRGITVFGRTVEPSLRVLVWESALRTIGEKPLSGTGIGVDPASVSYQALNGDRLRLTDAHNMLLNVAGQAGIPAALILLLLLGHLLWRLLNSNPEDAVTTGLLCAFLGAVVYQGVTGSFENARHIWVLFGLIGACTRR